LNAWSPCYCSAISLAGCPPRDTQYWATVSNCIVHSCSPNATKAHHSIRLYSTLKLTCFSGPRNLYLFSLHSNYLLRHIRTHTQIQYPLPETVFSSGKMAYSRAIAQAVSSRPLTTGARVHSQGSLC
jgi:hypothetical protein